MCLNGQKNIKWLIFYSGVLCEYLLHKYIQSDSDGTTVQCFIVSFPCFCIYVTVSVSFVSISLFTQLPVINYGKQIFLKYTRDSFNSWLDTSRQDIDDSFNVCTKQETEWTYIVSLHTLQLLISQRKKKGINIKTKSQQFLSWFLDTEITKLDTLFICCD